MILRTTTLLATLLIGFSFTAKSMILPTNNLHLQDHPSMVENITEEEFIALIERVENYYAPIVENHGGKLTVEKRWTDRTVNAYAQRLGDDWIVSMFGGLARREEVTHDGFSLVVCHEAGHHLGGFPFTSSWASNEGQSDYFATQSCARNIWKDDLATNATFRETADETAKLSCDAIYSETADQDLCYRIAMAGKSLADLLAALGRQEAPSFETPDTTVVSSTNHRHPKAQCRLDTYLNGALCTAEFDETVIPGEGDKDRWGNKNKAEKSSLKYSCSQFKEEHVLSQRPKCWFKQKVDDSEEETED